jgi:hypothetical protein
VNAAELGSRLDARRVGREWHAFCPVHHGESRSLHFRDGDAGGVVLICRAGCQTQDVLTALGLSWRDISPDSPREPVPEIVRAARHAASSSISRNLPASVRQQPLTLIFTGEDHLDQAIARALALVVVRRELVQLALAAQKDRA